MEVEKCFDAHTVRLHRGENQRITFKTLNIKHFINNNIIVPHVKYNVNMFSMRKKSVTRAGKKRLLDKNYKWKSCTFEKSFKHRAIDLWNSLPENLHDETLSFMKFNKLLYKYFLSQRNAVNLILLKFILLFDKSL